MLPTVRRLCASLARPSSPSRSTYQRPGLWQLYWRAVLSAVGILYLWASLTANMMMTQIIVGHLSLNRSVELLNRAVHRFPFDPYLRDERKIVSEQLQQLER